MAVHKSGAAGWLAPAVSLPTGWLRDEKIQNVVYSDTTFILISLSMLTTAAKVMLS